MNTLTIEAFGRLQPLFGPAFEWQSEAATVAELLAELAQREAGFGPELASTAVARGEEILQRGAALNDGDTLALIPPVGGG